MNEFLLFSVILEKMAFAKTSHKNGLDVKVHTVFINTCVLKKYFFFSCTLLKICVIRCQSKNVGVREPCKLLSYSFSKAILIS